MRLANGQTPTPEAISYPCAQRRPCQRPCGAGRELKGLEDAEKRRLAGKVVLQLALNRLARHYGLDVPDETRRRRKGIRHWGSEDYRPTLDTWQGGSDQ